MDASTKALQCMATVCSCLNYFGHVVIGVTRQGNYSLTHLTIYLLTHLTTLADLNLLEEILATLPGTYSLT